MAYEVVESPGGSIPFSLKIILVELERTYYVRPILPTSMADLVAGRISSGVGATRGGSSDGGGAGAGAGGGGRKPTPKVVTMGGAARVQALYEAHLPSLSLWYR